MSPETTKRVRTWPFRRAPVKFQKLFPNGGDLDWIAHIPESERDAVEPTVLQWRPVYPVRLAELPDRSVVYLGAPRHAVDLISSRRETVTPLRPAGVERRTAPRFPMECPSHYETSTHAGFGHTIDLSSTGIAFTTETLLASNTKVTLHVMWPVRLEGDVPVAFYASGELVRVEPVKAAMQVDRVGFSIRK